MCVRVKTGSEITVQRQSEALTHTHRPKSEAMTAQKTERGGEATHKTSNPELERYPQKTKAVCVCVDGTQVIVLPEVS